MIKRALISVSNKEGIIELARELNKLKVEIISTGGTYALLKKNKIKVQEISEYTGFPEMLDGRLKTLHPKVHGGILAIRGNKKHMAAAKKHKIQMIDLVIVNLYPFEEKPGIENIDIGGPTMVRAAAKNHQDVGVVVDPEDYSLIIKELKEKKKLSLDTKKYLAQKAFAHTGYYDSLIADYLNEEKKFTKEISFGFKKAYELRYGENPHQAACFYTEPHIPEPCVATAKVLGGKQLSYNNIMDADAAINIVRDFAEPACAVIKHANPCGASTNKDITTAFQQAYNADKLSAFGGIIALNRECNEAIALKISKVFAEIVIATKFSAQALKILSAKKNLRLLETGKLTRTKKIRDLRKVVGGLLVQDLDRLLVEKKDLKVVTRAKPNLEQIKELLFAWRIIKHVKSNAILITKNNTTVGVGCGQVSRVDATDIALKKAGKNIFGCVLASDAYFPFRDSIDKLASEGIKAIIQPGGSIRDAEVIKACDEYGIAMVFTGNRAFKH
ncbi:MAG: bifunctional phosphoribosylaminoimidazolecarboxamide formyltransferase/IMP cyclohydrolase [Patescibacteria group bacterium]|jgi:phosphoribosylaminoimidazolecarboxamide formyltransferase/IMP cyclohydrolase